jgi:serine/threonine protein kinase
VGESSYEGWEKLRPLGKGGQSDVFLVRNPQRAAERERSLEQMRLAIGTHNMSDLATGSWTYSRPEQDSELGALKVFRLRRDHAESSPAELTMVDEEVQRFRNEVKVLSKRYLGLPKLLAHNEREFWIITEFFSGGSLERQLSKYTGSAELALVAFRSLVNTVAQLHDQGMVHRDIKPANVFVRNDEELVLGDLGIVFLPSAADRLTATNERVGPRDYMAPWLDTGDRIENVEPCSDVYMLGKLLWCMVSGKLKLPREDHRKAKFNLATIFPDSLEMERINLILDKCLVADSTVCLASAAELLILVDKAVREIQKGGNRTLANGELRLGCIMCGEGTYKLQTQVDSHVVIPQWNTKTGKEINSMIFRAFACNVCMHHVLFGPDPKHGVLTFGKSTSVPVA